MNTAQQPTPSAHTNKAYAADWRHFSRWCRLQGHSPMPPEPDVVASYLAELANPASGPALKVASIERRLAGLLWNCAQRGQPLDRNAPALASLMRDLRANHHRAPDRKQAIQPEEIHAMAATLPFDLRGLRDRALLRLGYEAGLGRTDLVGLDLGAHDNPEDDTRRGWIEISEAGAAVTYSTRTGQQTVRINRQIKEQICPVHALEQWLHFAKIQAGPVFVGISRDGKRALDARLNDKHVARLIKRTVIAAGLRPDLSEKERLALFSGHSLRSGLARSRKEAKKAESYAQQSE
ncbi:integrase [Shimia sp. MMG029]|uniref:integrase n=1 Tax=Shimia sp. MMG029 TaxID=3021978 RepID=UPI0022FE261A|nr:integrase [Shimia sp. MMG029]MDA5558980.1 integrase [Shimia sp. MMG029]